MSEWYMNEGKDNDVVLSTKACIVRNIALGLERSERGKATIKGKNDSTAYFATGDSFNCGSWISSETLEALSDNVGVKARRDAGEGSQAEKNALGWAIAGSGLVGGIGSFIGMNAIQNNGKSLGGLLNNQTTKNAKVTSAVKQCEASYNAAVNAYRSAVSAAGNVKTSGNDAQQTASASAFNNEITNLVSKANALRNAARSVNAALKNAGLTENGTLNRTTVFTASDFGISTATTYSSAPSVSGDNELQGIYTACQEANNSVEYDDGTEKKGLSKGAINGIAAGVGALATAGIAAGITRSVQKAKYENAQNAAVKEFMDSLGSKIHCYVGGELVGDFGDIITINIDE